MCRVIEPTAKISISVMNQLNPIAMKLAELKNLEKKDCIFLEDVDPIFRDDLQTFIIGETMTLKDGKLIIHRSLFRRWLQKIQTEGLDQKKDATT